MSKRIYFRNFKKANFIYPKNCLPLWIKNFLYKNNTSGKYELSEIQTGTEFTLNNTVSRKFNIFDLKGNTIQNGEPTPEVPIPIHNVSGNNNIKIQNKNLFDMVNIINGSFVDANNFLNKIYTETTNHKYRTVRIEDLPAGTYTISINWNYTARILRMYKDGVVISIGQDSNSYTFTTNSKGLFGITFRNTNSTNFTDNELNVQLEQGTAATTYVPHQEQNLPFTFAEGQKAMQGTTLQDDGIHQKRKQIVLDGTESWTKSSSNNVVYADLLDTTYKNKIKTTNILCSHLLFGGVATTSSGAYNYGNNTFSINNGGNTDGRRYYFRDDNISTIEEWTNFLTNQYANGTPVTLEVTFIDDFEEIIPYTATQQEQYNAIKQAKSYDDQTNISQTNDDLPFILDIQYWKLKEI